MEAVPATQPPRSRLGCFWKGFLISLAVLLLIVLLVGWQAYRTKSWIENGAESTPATPPQVRLSAEEEQGLNETRSSYEASYREKKDFDAVLTPAQFNRIVEDQIRNERAAGKQPGVEALQLAFEGRETVVRGAAPVRERPGMYHNFEVRGEVAVDHGHAAWSLGAIRLRGQEPPWAALVVARIAIGKKLTEQEELFTKGQDSLFSRIKLLRREGDKVHLILDGAHLEAPGR